MAALTAEQIATKVTNLRTAFAGRDQKMGDVHAVRNGNMQSVYPALWPEAWPKPIIANFIDTVARDLTEVIAPLPSFNCSSASMKSDDARKFADKRTQIAHWYILNNELDRIMLTAVDQYLTYGFVPFFVEPDFEDKTPRIRSESPMWGYPEFDRWGRLKSYTKVFHKTVRELRLLYPELAFDIRGGRAANLNQERADAERLELVRYMDKDQTVFYLPQRKNLVLQTLPNEIGKLLVQVAVRPNGHDDTPTGQFDDVIWVQMARAYMALLGLEATEKSVQAPIQVPPDVQEFAFGPDSIIRTQGDVRRVGLELPQGAFEEQQMLDTEQKVGSRYPDARTGNVQASVITGQGVQSLMGGFDTQIKTAQDVFKITLRKVIGDCFCLDEYWWPNTERTIRGEHEGAPFEIKYKPSKDIKGDYTIDVSYGFMSGMNPNQALVFMLQLRGDKAISRDLLRRQLPFGVNVTEEQIKVDAEEVRDALKQALFGVGQAAPEMVAQGMDPSGIIHSYAVLIQAINKGKSVEDAAELAFAPPPPPPAQEAAPGEGESPDQTQATPGIGPNGAQGVAPGQQGEGRGGRPALQALLAGLTSGGQPSLQANVTQRVPVQI